MPYRFDPENPFKEERTRAKAAFQGHNGRGLTMEHHFSTPGVHPFEQLEWENRSARISSDSGEAIFEQDNVEVPVDWSQLATNVVASKYFYGEIENGQREHSVKQLVHRVCRTIADWGKARRRLRQRGRRGDVLQRADLAVREPVRLVQFAGVVQRRPVPCLRHRRQQGQLPLGRRRNMRRCPARTATSTRRPPPASSSPSRTRWKTSCAWPRPRRCSSSTAPARAPTCPRCAAAGRSSPAAASRRAR